LVTALAPGRPIHQDCFVRRLPVDSGLATIAPTLFGALIQSASRTNVNYGYLIGAGLMLAAGIIAILLAVPAERRALEDLASPYTAVRGRGPTSIAAPARAN
jgi:hypothetical protein